MWVFVFDYWHKQLTSNLFKKYLVIDTKASKKIQHKFKSLEIHKNQQNHTLKGAALIELKTPMKIFSNESEVRWRHLPICTMGNLIMSCTNACTALSFFGYISFFEIESWKRSKFVAFLLYKQQEEEMRN